METLGPAVLVIVFAVLYRILQRAERKGKLNKQTELPALAGRFILILGDNSIVFVGWVLLVVLRRNANQMLESSYSTLVILTLYWVATSVSDLVLDVFRNGPVRDDVSRR